MGAFITEDFFERFERCLHVEKAPPRNLGKQLFFLFLSLFSFWHAAVVSCNCVVGFVMLYVYACRRGYMDTLFRYGALKKL